MTSSIEINNVKLFIDILWERNRRNVKVFIAKSQKESIIANWDNFVNIDKLVLILKKWIK